MTSDAAQLPIALTIAGSDSSGGAGIQADIKTFAAFGVYGASVITALTAQNTQGVQALEAVAPAFVEAQLRSVLDDFEVGAIKTGMLASADVLSVVADVLLEYFAAPTGSSGGRLTIPLVVDPVMVASSGETLLAPDAVEMLKTKLIPLASLLTPNLPEAAALLGCAAAVTEDDRLGQARQLLRLGPAAVLLKGGHGQGVGGQGAAKSNCGGNGAHSAGRCHQAQRMAVDLLYSGAGSTFFEKPWIETRNSHGTGCTLSAAMAAALLRGEGLNDAVNMAKNYLWAALDAAKDQQIGGGIGPLQHFSTFPNSAK